MKALAAVLLLAGYLVATAAPAGAAANRWQIVPAETNSNQDFILNSVDVPAAGDVWAVGYHWETVGGALEFRTLAEHYDGTRFEVVPTPDRETAPAVDELEGVSGTASNDVWAVGTSLPAGVPDRTLTEHWNGSSWSIVTSADPGAHGNVLEAVDAIASNDAWAVGGRQDVFYQQPLAEHWTGSSWTAVDVPNPSACTGHSYLTDVAALSSRNVWASGWCGSGGSGGDQSYLVRWNGRRWSSAADIGFAPARSQLYGVAPLSTHNIWAVGYVESSGASPGALVLHYDGTSWTRLPVNAPQDQASLYALLAGYGGAPWVVGAGPSPQPPFAGPSTAQFSGGVGHPAAVPVDFGSLRGIAYDPTGRLWAVGQQLPGAHDTPLVISRPTG